MNKIGIHNTVINNINAHQNKTVVNKVSFIPLIKRKPKNK